MESDQDSWTVFGAGAQDIPPERAELVEALMCLARQMRDKEGRNVFFRLPPALADLLINVLTTEEPLLSARALLCEIQKG